MARSRRAAFRTAGHPQRSRRVRPDARQADRQRHVGQPGPPENRPDAGVDPARARADGAGALFRHQAAPPVSQRHEDTPAKPACLATNLRHQHHLYPADDGFRVRAAGGGRRPSLPDRPAGRRRRVPAASARHLVSGALAGLDAAQFFVRAGTLVSRQRHFVVHGNLAAGARRHRPAAGPRHAHRPVRPWRPSCSPSCSAPAAFRSR